MSRPDTGAERHDFLHLRHGDGGFLIERSLFFASVYLEQTGQVPYPERAGTDEPVIIPEYFNKTMVYGGLTLMMFELDSYLGSIFGNRDTGVMKIALVASIDSFSRVNRDYLRGVIFKLSPEASTAHIAFRVGSHAEIKNITFESLRLLPPHTRPRLYGVGVIGCRFPETGSVDFLLDLESLIFNNLKQESVRREAV